MTTQHRVLGVGAVAVAAALTLTACGGGETPPTAQDGEVAGEIQYSWWGGPARNDKTQAVIDLYEEATPGVTVNGTTAEFAAYFESASVQAAVPATRGRNRTCRSTYSRGRTVTALNCATINSDANLSAPADARNPSTPSPSRSSPSARPPTTGGKSSTPVRSSRRASTRSR